MRLWFCWVNNMQKKKKKRERWNLRVCARNVYGTMESQLNKEGNEARRNDEKVTGSKFLVGPGITGLCITEKII